MQLVEALQIEYIHVQETTVEAKMRLSAFHSQEIGYLHGGATIAFGETIAGVASNQLAGETRFAVGQSVNANLLRKKKIEGFLIARGKLLYQGRRSHVWSIDFQDERDVLIAQMTITNVVIDRP